VHWSGNVHISPPEFANVAVSAAHQHDVSLDCAHDQSTLRITGSTSSRHFSSVRERGLSRLTSPAVEYSMSARQDPT